MNPAEIRVRFPPSPTGFLHIGNIRTFVFNWLFAKQNKGMIVLRMEDTDRERSEKHFEKLIIEDLKWLGLDYDEFGGRQSERTDIYNKYLKQLLDSGEAYEDDGAIKIKVDTGKTIIFDDVIRGRIEFDTKHEKDFVIARNLDSPLYHLAVVVDDYEMRISHIIRGEDHIANTAKHILLQEALGFTSPIYAHLPLILGSDKSKLSKRHGAVALDEYKEQGFLPDAMFNYLAILGYTPSAEIISREELIKEFELTKIHKAGAVFDIKKLEWINGEYIKKMSNDELLATIGQKYEKILPMVRERMKKKSDLEEFDFFFEAPTVDPELLKWKKASLEESKAMLAQVKEIIEQTGLEDIRAKLDAIGAGDRGLVYWPFRVALSGRKASPDPVDIAIILGKDEVLRRIENVNIKDQNDN
ncbi:MAG: glutamate--tRNA ligase family protein [Patescibacteria group bacterium]